MTHFRNSLKKIVAASIIATSIIVTVKAQTTAEVYSDSDSCVIVKIDNINSNNAPKKILLVYDSNLITLENTSSSAHLLRQSTSNSLNSSNYGSPTSLSSVLAVEFEKEMEVEEWMLEPFKTTGTNAASTKVDLEPEMPVESWMKDLSSW